MEHLMKLYKSEKFCERKRERERKKTARKTTITYVIENGVKRYNSINYLPKVSIKIHQTKKCITHIEIKKISFRNPFTK